MSNIGFSMCKYGDFFSKKQTFHHKFVKKVKKTAIFINTR